MPKRPIDSFFAPKVAKRKIEPDHNGPDRDTAYDQHASYPIPLPARFPFDLVPNSSPKSIKDKTDLDLLYYQPLFPAQISRQLFEFLRKEFCWYRVTYQVRGITINTPRFTTVFGLDDTHYFSGPDATGPVLEKTTDLKPKKAFKCVPRPLPGCLNILRSVVEGATGETFNFCLLNYYKDGTDSISYHSDDESFLGPNPSIASISLGASRDFLMRNKADHTITFKTPLKSGEMILMKGTTQSKWDHSIPKRKGDIGGRINITFRKAVVPYGTENYYRYNVHDGPYYRWDAVDECMVLASEFEEKQKARLSSPKVEQNTGSDVPKTVKDESFDLEAAVAQIEQLEKTGASQEMNKGEVKIHKEESFDLEAQIKAIDEAVANKAH